MPDEPHPFSKIAEELVGDLRHLPAPDEPRHTIGGRPGRPKPRPTRPLTELVEQLMQKHQIGRSSPEQTIRDHWTAIVDPNGGNANASNSHPARIERNRLVVLVPHSVVRNELFHHREEIVARIRQLPGCESVKSLLLRAG